MSINAFILSLSEKDIKLSLVEGKVKVTAPVGSMTDEDKQTLKTRKDEILKYIKESSGKTVVPTTAIKTLGDRSNLKPSFAQNRLWFIEHLEQGTTLYNMPMGFRLKGALNIDALNFALNSIVLRHESLRTVFKQNESGELYQVIQSHQETELTLLDVSDLSGKSQATKVDELILEEARRGFDLSLDLMLRSSLLKLSATEHVLRITMHHIASDGWSIGIFVNELQQYYTRYLEGNTTALAPLPIQYADYAHWQRQWLQGSVLEEQVDYWRKQLTGLPVVHNLPLDRARPAQQRFVGGVHRHRLSRVSSEGLMRLCQSQGATLFMGLHAAFSILLSRYSGERDIVMGSPIANREQVEVESLIGFFINTLVLRSDLSGTPSFIDLLTQSKSMALDAYAHQQVPFEQLVEVLQPERSLSHTPLFQILLVLQNNEFKELVLTNLSVNPVMFEETGAKFDMTLNIVETDAGLMFNWEYNIDLFDASSIARMAQHFEVLLHGLIATPERDVFSLALLSDKEREQILLQWNATKRDYAADKCIHELFEAQVERSPNETA